MSKWFSIYLDVVRLGAALFVVYAHTNVRFLLPEKLPLAEFAHSAVTIFFVLSGYVVAYVADNRERTLSEFASSRAARILSLSVLAVLLTPILDSIGRNVAPDIYLKTIPSDYALVRIAASLFFLAEIWTISITTFSNVPYWSLNYEVWYYVLFGIYCFASPQRRWFAIGAICLMLGPKIVLMAPCWLAGVLAYRWRWKKSAGFPSVAVFLWLSSLLAFWGYHRVDLMRAFSDGFVSPVLGQWVYTQLHFSRYFAADWLLSAIVAVNFIAARRIASCLPELRTDALKWVGYVGGLTYALYIIHFPFVYMWGAIWQEWVPSMEKYATVLGMTFVSVAIVAFVGEWLRPRIRASFSRLIRRDLLSDLVARLRGSGA